jgi:Coenzyme PQQ synthesis protein D (PqqD)
MAEIKLDDKPIRNESCHMEELDDEVLLYNPTNNKTLYINKSASVIWQLCNGEQAVEDIITMIQEAYPSDDDGLRQDILDTLNSLAENDAVTLA